MHVCYGLVQCLYKILFCFQDPIKAREVGLGSFAQTFSSPTFTAFIGSLEQSRFFSQLLDQLIPNKHFFPTENSLHFSKMTPLVLHSTIPNTRCKIFLIYFSSDNLIQFMISNCSAKYKKKSFYFPENTILSDLDICHLNCITLNKYFMFHVIFNDKILVYLLSANVSQRII